MEPFSHRVLLIAASDCGPWSPQASGQSCSCFPGNHNSWTGGERPPQRWQSDQSLKFKLFLIFDYLYVQFECGYCTMWNMNLGAVWPRRTMVHLLGNSGRIRFGGWTAVQWFYAINGSCKKDQKRRCSRVPIVMLFLVTTVTSFKLLQVQSIEMYSEIPVSSWQLQLCQTAAMVKGMFGQKFSHQRGFQSCEVLMFVHSPTEGGFHSLKKASLHSPQVSDLLSELKARREQVQGQRNLESEAQKHHLSSWVITAWLCDGWNPVSHHL